MRKTAAGIRRVAIVVLSLLLAGCAVDVAPRVQPRAYAIVVGNKVPLRVAIRIPEDERQKVFTEQVVWVYFAFDLKLALGATLDQAMPPSMAQIFHEVTAAPAPAPGSYDLLLVPHLSSAHWETESQFASFDMRLVLKGSLEVLDAAGHQIAMLDAEGHDAGTVTNAWAIPSTAKTMAGHALEDLVRAWAERLVGSPAVMQYPGGTPPPAVARPAGVPAKPGATPVPPAAAPAAPPRTAAAATAATAAPGPGVFALESAIDFNVLDAVMFDPRAGRVTLVGHRDPRYGTARIPYLQHLAELLEHPDPRFTLTWTPESEAQIGALFRRLDNPDEVRKIAAQWGYWIDERGQVTAAGRHFMPIFGVTPTNDRYEIVAAMLRAIGNERAATITSLFGAAKRAEDTPAFQGAMQNVVAAVGALDDLNRLKGQVQRGEISDWDGQVGFGRAVCSRLDQAFELSQQPVLRTFEQVMQSRRDLATAFTAAFAELDRQLRTILGTTMQKLLARHDEVTVPPDVIQATVGVRPEVVPEYIDANPHSQTARVMFDADYIAKQIPNRPELAKKIPRYMTDFAYERAHRAEAGRFKPTVTQHLWISVDGMELAESPDKTTLETRAVRMRFNIRDKVEGRSVPGSASGYETLLTSIYDDLAVEFPVLHETREVVKIGAAADWIRARKPEFRLPAAGRTAWTGAARLPGLVYMTWTPNPRPGQVTASMMAMGGWEARRRAIERKIAELNVKIAWLAHAPGADPADVGRIAGLTAFPQPLGWVRRGTKDGVAVTALTIVPGRDEAGATVSRPGEDGGAIVWRIADLEGFEKETRARLAAAGADQRQAALQHALLAEALHEKGDDKAAIAELNEALRLAPDLPLIHLLRAKALAESGDVAGAKAALKQYLTLEPGNAAAAALLRDLDAPAAPGAGAQPGAGREMVGAGGQVRLGATFQQAKAMQLEGPRVSGPGMGTARGFDTPTTVTPPLAPGFTMKGLARPLPPAVLQHPKMIELRREDARLEKEQQRVDQELQAVRVKKARREGDAKELEATETKLKQERQDLITKRDELETKMVDLGVQLEEGGKADTGAAPGAPADGVAPPAGAPSAPSTSPTAPSTSAPGPKR